MNNPYQAPDADPRIMMLPCVGCGKSLHVTASSCPECGASQRSRSYKGKGVAAALAFLLGTFGVHRFYLGQWWGLIYLVLFWTGLPGLVAFVEMIVFLVTDQQKWDDKHNGSRPAGPNDKSGGAIIAVVVIFAVVFMVGILAAIAVPAYQDYTLRAQVAQSMTEIQPVREQIQSFEMEHRLFPDSNIMLGIDEPLSLSNGHTAMIEEAGKLVITYGGDTSPLAGQTLELEPYKTTTGYEWQCYGGSLEERYRLPSCRQ